MAYNSAEAMQARYNEIANSLLDKPGSGVGHTRIGLDDGGNFISFDTQFKDGKAAASYGQQGNSVRDALASLQKDFGLDAGKVEAPTMKRVLAHPLATGGAGQVDQVEALGSVNSNTSARAAFQDIFNRYLKGQFDAKLAGVSAPPPAAAPPKAAAAPPAAPPQYGQPPAPAPGGGAPPPGPPAGPVQPSAPPPPPEPPAENLTPPGPGFETPGWQGPTRRYNDLPTGPALVSVAPLATAGDPYMEYLAPVYRTPKRGDAAYDEMGIDPMARYGFGPEALFFANGGEYKIS